MRRLSSNRTLTPAALLLLTLAASPVGADLIFPHEASAGVDALSYDGPARVAGAPALATPSADTLALRPCQPPGVPPPVECGTLEVWEDREARTGRRIVLNVVRLGATGPEAAADPIVPILGGPGQSATGSAPGLAQELAELRIDRDIVLVDQRGTGESHPLECRLFGPPDDLQSYLGAFLPPEAVRACRSELERRADLTLYGTHLAADDLDQVRAALGYERINLYAISYGTRAALTYIRRHGERVRTATLFGVYPPGRHGPALFAPNAQRALDGVLADCLAHPDCAAAFPRIREEAGVAFRRLAEEPGHVAVVHPHTGRPDTVTLSRELAAEAVRYMMYSPASTTFLPIALHQAASGDLTLLAEQALFGRMRIVDSGANGLYLSITCAEEVAPVDSAEAARLGRGTFMGDYRYRDQAAACRHWPHGRTPEELHEPVVSSVPILLVSGEWDPATPPGFAEAAAAHLARSRHLVVPHGGHGSDGLEGASECIGPLVRDFIVAAAAERLDASCLDSVRRPPFRTEPLPMGVAEVDAAVLQALEGRYVAEDGSLEVVVQAVEGGFRVVLPDDAVLLHVPVGPDRYRTVGLPGYYLQVTREDGSVSGLELEQPGGPPLRLPRVD